LLKTTASFSGALRAICWAVLARWSGFGALIVAATLHGDHAAVHDNPRAKSICAESGRSRYVAALSE
jgi:hypothetical protein